MRFILPYLLIALFILLPFHALGTTSITHFFLDSGSPIPVFLKIWKEILLGVIFLGIGYLNVVGNNGHDKSVPLRQKFLGFVTKFFKNLDAIDWLIISFSAMSVFISALNFPENSLTNSTYGIKYTLFPLWIFFIFRRIPSEISGKFLERFWKIFPIFSGIFIFSGILFFVFAQQNPENFRFFQFLGYSTDHSFYSLFQPLSYCQKISFTEICRAQSVMSGPNQLGAYLLFLIMGVLVGAISNRPNDKKQGHDKSVPLQKHIFPVLFLTSILLLIITFSRSAWIGGVFAGAFFLTNFFVGNAYMRSLRKKFLAGIILIPIFFISVFSVFLPEISDKIINRVSSSSEHYELSIEAAKNIIENPFGQGLGKAGAASKYESEKGLAEVGLIPENWYLQIGIETGILGIIFWFLILFFVVKKLLHIKNVGNSHGCSLQMQNFPLAIASAIFGISIMGISLHSWESSAVAYSVWGLAGILLRKN